MSAPTLTKRLRVVVNVSDMAIEENSGANIITHALGSCIAAVAYDPTTGIGGMLHYLLPMSRLMPDRAAENPAMFGDTGIPMLFKALFKVGANRKHLRIGVFGGASVIETSGDIGRRNYAIARKLFWKNKLRITHDQTGGTDVRTVNLDTQTGLITVTTRYDKFTLGENS